MGGLFLYYARPSGTRQPRCRGGLFCPSFHVPVTELLVQKSVVEWMIMRWCLSTGPARRLLFFSTMTFPRLSLHYTLPSSASTSSFQSYSRNIGKCARLSNIQLQQHHQSSSRRNISNCFWQAEWSSTRNMVGFSLWCAACGLCWLVINAKGDERRTSLSIT